MKWWIAALPLLLGGCTIHYGSAELPVFDPQRTVVLGTSTVRSLHVTTFRKAVYQAVATLTDPISKIAVQLQQRGCAQGMSGNLGYAMLGAAAAVAPPITTSAVAAGVAGTEYVKSRNPKLSHDVEPCPAFQAKPPPIEAVPVPIPPIPEPMP